MRYWLPFIFLFLCHHLSSQCDHPDYEGLIELYDALNGEDWILQNGWEEGKSGESCDPCSFNGKPWLGLQCENDRVVRLVLSNMSGAQGELVDLKLTELQILGLENMKISGSIPDFQYLPKLIELKLNDNILSETLPDFSNLKNLYYLFLSGNFLKGNIPDFRNLDAIISISLASNAFTDTIPDFNHMEGLINLSLNDNRLSGSIPNFSKLEKLKLFDCGENQLTGNIPNLKRCLI